MKRNRFDKRRSVGHSISAHVVRRRKKTKERDERIKIPLQTSVIEGAISSRRGS